MTVPPPAIEATGLRKSHGATAILAGVDLRVPAGTVCALLGPNGSGKTAVLRILAGRMRPDAGTVRVAGHDLARDPGAARAAIGLAGHPSTVDDRLTGEENLLRGLRHLGRARARRRAAALLERLGLTGAATLPAAACPAGVRRRLDLALALTGDPSVLLLDEPTAGLDPRARRAVWENVRDLAAGGLTVLLTTQDLAEAGELAGRVAVLDRGRLVAEGTPAELRRRAPGGHVLLRLAGPEVLDRAARALGATGRDDRALTLRVPHDGSVPALHDLLGRLDDALVDVEELTLHTPDLGDAFLALTGQTAT
ncbi:ABC transporter ATP-binding protein [Bailinhaonella thermotolerans]|uniref:ABC transporter ATP-binding protein n=1 Tax=Bailinhaonella thermotolerans TaxID=1070861 RepID=A0A3A4AJ90_9ACTN|nr:ABC transporter ATP-binding protein [Bailinhaonella thermotolerans]RJL27144.1 ABC transporter ATP-binding protein [Bailinhaonella thermotolerans]